MQRNINISDVTDCMADPSCKDLCKFMIHRWVKGFDKWSNGFSGTHVQTGCSAAAGQQGQRAHKNDISFILDPMAMKFLRGVCKYINYVLAKGYTTGFKGSTGNTDADRQQHMLSKKDNNMIAGKLRRN